MKSLGNFSKKRKMRITISSLHYGIITSIMIPEIKRQITFMPMLISFLLHRIMTYS